MLLVSLYTVDMETSAKGLRAKPRGKLDFSYSQGSP
jgi:hypothetical protein